MNIILYIQIMKVVIQNRKFLRFWMQDLNENDDLRNSAYWIRVLGFMFSVKEIIFYLQLVRWCLICRIEIHVQKKIYWCLKIENI